MARAQATDPLHNFRFHAQIIGSSTYQGAIATDVIGDQGTNGEAGFSAITIPEVSAEAAEYREGIRTWTEKYPGVPTVGQVTLSRGVARYETNFFDWMLAVIEGREYKGDLVIYHFPRAALERTAVVTGGTGNDGLGIPDGAISRARKYHCFNAHPSRVKIAADMDATSSDVSIAEMDVEVERVWIEKPT